MNVHVAKVIGIVTLMLGILGALIGCIALKADPPITAGLATAFGAAATVVVQWLTKNGVEKAPPSGPLAVLLVAGAAALAQPSCTPAHTPREQTRSVVLSVAEGVRVGDEACAYVARGKADLALAETCAAIVKEAREALLVAEAGIDVWSAANEGTLSCAVSAASNALGRILDTITRAGGKIPPAVDDALRLAPVLAEACRG